MTGADYFPFFLPDRDLAFPSALAADLDFAGPFFDLPFVAFPKIASQPSLYFSFVPTRKMVIVPAPFKAENAGVRVRFVDACPQPA